MKTPLSFYLIYPIQCKENIMARRIDIFCAELRHLYEDERLGIVAIAARYGCSSTTISLRLRDCGVPTRETRFQSRDIPADELRQLYEVERWPIAAIARHFGVSISTVGNRRRMLGIPIRPRIALQRRTETS
jgi:AraC-like DNA-binding protein